MRTRTCLVGALITVGVAIATANLAWMEMSTSHRSDCLLELEAAPVVAPVPVSRTARILYVETAPGALRGVLADGGFDVFSRLPSELPTNVAELARYDLVLISDIPAHLLLDEQVSALDRYVEGGGSVLMAGGIDSFGSGAYSATPIEHMLPVRFDSCCRQLPDMALVVVVDTSASMRGARIEAVRKSLQVIPETLGPNDFLAVVGVDRSARIPVRPQRAANRQRVAAGVAQLVATDDPLFDLDAGLGEARDMLDGINTRRKHVIVLTDGPVRSRDLLDGKITFSRLAPAGQLDRTLRKDIVQALGHDDETVRVRIAQRGHAIANTGVASAPALGGYVTTRAKPAAETILMSDTGEPILARWCRGKGTAVVWTSDVDRAWSVEWTRWTGYAAFWSQVVRSSLARPCPSRP